MRAIRVNVTGDRDRFTVTSGKTSKANGTSLKVKLSYPSSTPGTYANVAKVKVSLPKELPSRLTTLQKACTAQVFDQNPANCPKESIVGQAKVLTPLLPVPLTGPAYFVSHAAEAFPDLTIVLQGYGITVKLIGSTQIKNGITTSTFKATFSSFELNLIPGSSQRSLRSVVAKTLERASKGKLARTPPTPPKPKPQPPPPLSEGRRRWAMQLLTSSLAN